MNGREAQTPVVCDVDESRVLVLLPTAKDGQRAADALATVDIACTVCKDLPELCRELARGAGALLLTEDRLVRGDAEVLTAALAAEPTWSAIPVIVIARESRLDGRDPLLTELAVKGTLVERPVRMRTFLSVVQTALRARKHQYVIRDAILLRERQAEQLRANQQALQEADRSKDAFIAMLAHELRNPLAPLRTGLEILRRTSPGSSAKTQEMMERQLGHLIRLVDDLLDVSRITRGLIELKREPVALQAIISAGIEGSSALLHAARHSFHVETPEAPAWLDADPTRLSQVISNLLNNAAKYTPGGGRVALRARCDGQEAIIEVSDDGVGIAAEDLAGIFQMFTQVHHTRDRAQGGLGIGLALARSLVTMHGGTIAVTSEGPGRGSTFTVRLPLAAEPRTAGAPALGRVATHSSRRQVLVVDDNIDGAESLSMLLELKDCDVRVAHDAHAALAIAGEFVPEIVFLDIGLPGIDGYELARRLRKNPSLVSATLIALTGWGTRADKERAEEAGFDSHFTKPIREEQLTQLLARGGRQW